MTQAPMVPLNIKWDEIDRNRARVQDPSTGFEFVVITRPKERQFVAGRPVAPRLYIHGERFKDDDRFERKVRAEMIDHVKPMLETMFSREINMKWSARAGCSCGCSPGWILDLDAPFDIWVDANTPR